MKRSLFICCFVLLIACERKTSEGVSQSDSLERKDSVLTGTLKIEDALYRSSGNAVADSLQWYLKHQVPMSKSLYKTIFGEDLTGDDKVYVSDILKSVKSFNPVVTIFNTVECDQETEYIDLHLFDKNWKLKGSKSFRYSVGYELYSQNYQFLTDSTLEISASQGLDYDNDDAIETKVILRLNHITLFDTVSIKSDTIRRRDR
jgi:hypothetical protein